MKETDSIPKKMGAIGGFAVGVIWLALAANAIWGSVQGYANGRSDWGLGWGLVGFFLLAAALSALVGTWWHNFRVKRDHH